MLHKPQSTVHLTRLPMRHARQYMPWFKHTLMMLQQTPASLKQVRSRIPVSLIPPCGIKSKVTATRLNQAH